MLAFSKPVVNLAGRRVRDKFPQNEFNEHREHLCVTHVLGYWGYNEERHTISALEEHNDELRDTGSLATNVISAIIGTNSFTGTQVKGFLRLRYWGVREGI